MPYSDALSIRRFRPEDTATTARLFHDAVHRGTRAFYTQAQREAWAPAVPQTESWHERLIGQSVFVAELEGEIAGFMTLRGDGYIDLAFVAPDLTRRGIARELYRAIEAEAAGMDLRRLYAHASHVARPFFERQGWSTLREQTVSPRGVAMMNFVMEKALS
jgi:putative acetyltransferase